ncbi:MAG: xanthine dehydrogenase family protein subunit M [Gemmatimonadetes bacterium]|nr:xanthine dehydrogenase family protein subunit M [Gemmatimonadota bacterium]
MIPAAFEYTRARSLADALKAAGTRGTKVIAGGQSLVPLLRFRLAQPSVVVDIGHLPQLQGIKRAKQGTVIGAATTYRDLLDSKLLHNTHPIIAETTAGIGDRQVRNRGTIGGGLAHADPASDMPAVVLALDAVLTLQSRRGKRSVPARKFFKGPFATAMKKDELLTEILLPFLPQGAGTAYESFEQAASGYALVGVAAVVAVSGGAVTHAAVGITGLADTPFFAASAAKLIGRTPNKEILRAAAAAAVEGVSANEDIHASAEYRLHLARVAVRKALTTAAGRAG